MSDAAHAATEAAFAEHDAAAGGDAAPEASERYPESDLSSIIGNAYDEAEAKATVDEYRENYHTGEAAEKREADRAEARGDENVGDLQGIADKYGPYLKSRGFSLSEAVERLIATDHAIGSAGPEAQMAMISQMVQSYGVNPADLATMTPEAAEYAMQAHRADLQQAYQTADQLGAQARVDAFAVAKDEAGNLLHPFFREVEGKMARIAQADQALGGKIPSIPTLYKRAIAGDTRIAYRMQAMRAGAEAEKAETAARLKRAKAAGSSVTGSGGEAAPQSNQGKTDLGDVVAAAMAQYGA